MMNSVADQVLQQFAANFAARVALLSAPPTGTPPEAAPAPAPQQLNGPALFWAMLKSWLRGLTSKREG
jgi:hypothetical protein